MTPNLIFNQDTRHDDREDYDFSTASSFSCLSSHESLFDFNSQLCHWLRNKGIISIFVSQMYFYKFWKTVVFNFQNLWLCKFSQKKKEAVKCCYSMCLNFSTGDEGQVLFPCNSQTNVEQILKCCYFRKCEHGHLSISWFEANCLGWMLSSEGEKKTCRHHK